MTISDLSVLHGGIPVAAFAILVTGCGGVVDPPAPVLWEAAFEATAAAPADMRGSAAMVAQMFITEAGVGVQGGPPGASLGWGIRNGTCPGNGDMVVASSAFPVLTINDMGEGQAEVMINRRLSPTGTYAAEVFANADGTGDVLLCADLERRG